MPAVGVHHTATSGGSWDASANVSRIKDDASTSVLRGVFAWCDSSGNKSDCKFPHHFVSSDGTGGAASTVACSAGIAALNGARGGSNVPSGDRSGIYRHLATHLKDAGKDVPELKSLGGVEVERRYTPVTVEMRTFEGSPSRIGGYAAVFNRLSQNLGGFVENVNPTFFARAANEGFKGVVCRFNHDDNFVLGTSTAGTLRLRIDDTGLDYEVDPPASRADVAELVSRGDVSKSSFAFRALEDDWTMTEQGFPLRNLISGQLIDVAPVVSPAYMDTSSGLRSLARKFDADFEEVLFLADQNELRKFFVRTDQPPLEKAVEPSVAEPEVSQIDPIMDLRAKRLSLMQRIDSFDE